MHTTEHPVSGTDGAQVLQCADRRPFYFLSLTVGVADPRYYKPHQLNSMMSQKLMCIQCLPPPLLQPLLHLGEELYRAKMLLVFLSE